MYVRWNAEISICLSLSNRRVKDAQDLRKATTGVVGNQVSADYMRQLDKNKKTALRARAEEERKRRDEYERRMNPPQQGNI